MFISRPSILSPLIRDSAIRRYAGIAVAACGVDLLTKEIAVRSLGETGWVLLTDRLSLTLVWNTGAAGGTSIGPFTWLINVVVTVLALGLVSGGAVGNLASIVAGPVGVADFLAVRLSDDLTMVANVADLFLWAGALTLVPVGATLVRMARAERRAARPRLVPVQAELA